MNNTKRKLGISLVVMLVTVFMLLGSTYAWFTDSVSNTGNRIQAGTLDIDLLMYDKEEISDTCDGYVSIANGSGDIFKEAAIAQNSNETLWEPGKTQWVFLAVQNKGSLALKYNIYVDVTDEGLIGSLEYAIIDGATAESTIPNSWDDIKTAAGTANVGNLVAGRILAAQGGVLDEIAYDSSKTNETDYFALAVHMKEDAGNEYQGKDAIIDVNVVATQATAEEDGFNSNQYDVVDIISPAEPINKTINSKAISMSAGVSTIDKIDGNSASGISVIDIKNVNDETVKATLPIAAAQKVMNNLLPTTAKTDEDRNMTLVLSVKTEEVNNLSVTYNIDVKAELNYVDSEGKAQTLENQTVGTLDDWLTATLQIGKSLNNVNVKHNNDQMEVLPSVASNPTSSVGGFFYDPNTGILTIKSKLFSPFTVSYDASYAGGDGTKENPYVISNEEWWKNFVKLTKDDSDFSETNGKYFKVTCDLDVSSWTERANIHYFAGNIDFCNHEFTGLTSTNAPQGDVGDDGITAIFSRVSKTVSISNLKFLTTKITNESHTVAAQVTGRNTGNVNITYKNVDTYGSVTGTNINNNGLLISYVYNGEADITMIDCDNYANLIGNGLKSVFLGNMGYGTVKTIKATNCYNYGTIVSKNTEASMFVSNPGYFSTNRIVTIENCSNKGTILQGSSVRHNLFTTKNDSQYLYVVNGNNLANMTDDAFNSATSTDLSGSLVQTISSTSLDTNEGKFILNSTEGSKKYELTFSFTAGGAAFGGSAGYTLQLTPEELENANIYVYDWINLVDTTSEVVAHNEYGTTYYTSDNHYVYNRENSTIRDNVFVTFTAFGENDAILSMQTYTYGN